MKMEDRLFDAEKEYTRQRFIEIDGKFTQQEKNVAFALAAQKELAQSSLASSEKAIIKAEDAQKAYNSGHNDLARKMDDTYKQMLPRAESDERQKNQEEKIESHRKELADLRTKIEEIRVRGSVSQPLQDKSFEQIADLLEARSNNKGKEDWINRLVPWIIAGGALFYEIFKSKVS